MGWLVIIMHFPPTCCWFGRRGNLVYSGIPARVCVLSEVECISAAIHPTNMHSGGRIQWKRRERQRKKGTVKEKQTHTDMKFSTLAVFIGSLVVAASPMAYRTQRSL